MLGSALAFAGRGEACAIRVENASASRTHCALLRGPSAAYAIDLLGRRTLLNDRPIGGASALLDGDVLTLGRARFAVRVDGPRPPDAPEGPPGPREAMLALMVDAAGPGRAPTGPEILDLLRQFRADAATLLEAQIGRIEALNREIASLRDEIRGHRGPPGPPPPPLRLDLSTPTIPSEGSARWLLDRLDAVEAEGRSTWKDLLGRRPSTRPGPSPDDRS